MLTRSLRETRGTGGGREGGKKKESTVIVSSEIQSHSLYRSPAFPPPLLSPPHSRWLALAGNPSDGLCCGARAHDRLCVSRNVKLMAVGLLGLLAKGETLNWKDGREGGRERGVKDESEGGREGGRKGGREGGRKGGREVGR